MKIKEIIERLNNYDPELETLIYMYNYPGSDFIYNIYLEKSVNMVYLTNEKPDNES